MILNKKTFAFAAGIALFVSSLAPAQLATKKSLTLDIAKQLAAACEKKAMSLQLHAFIVIADDGGNIMYVERMDDAQLGSFDVAVAKARSAVYFKRPTKMFEDAVHNGYVPLVKLPNAMPVEGGIPLMVDGKLIGAIGVSGGTPQQDGQMAQAGVDAFSGIIQAK